MWQGGDPPRSLRARVASPSIMEGSGFMKLPPDGVDKFAVEGVQDLPYDIPNLRIEYSQQEPGVQVWFWRSVGHSQNIFFSESLIDELAHAAGKDPFEYRRALLAKQPRYRGALELAAHPETPFKVVVNEAIELGKSFGGAEGHRFVNGVLEKLAAELRPAEVPRARQPA